MSPLQVCKEYLAAANRADLPGVLSFFTQDATVVSPLYGEMSVEDYHKMLFNDTKHSIIRLQNIFEAINDDRAMALQFNYTWVLNSGKSLNLELMSLFELAPKRNLLSKLTYIYDTAQLRTHLHVEAM
ncbi:nuclear transport factor 2 family protein [Noviherbaspirillum sp.]|uniref:nuclear transport factor 2 family protein n=1 Tax=Noviherbaspirillum sp. TaxID=1926288 RepID=UPI002FE0AC10